MSRTELEQQLIDAGIAEQIVKAMDDEELSISCSYGDWDEMPEYIEQLIYKHSH